MLVGLLALLLRASVDVRVYVLYSCGRGRSKVSDVRT